MVEFDIMYGEGVSKTGELVDLGVKAGVVEKSGAWFSYDSQRIGQGRENAKTFLKENPDIAAKIEAAVRGKFRRDRREDRSGRAKRTTTTTPRRRERGGIVEPSIAHCPACVGHFALLGCLACWRGAGSCPGGIALRSARHCGLIPTLGLAGDQRLLACRRSGPIASWTGKGPAGTTRR